MINDFTAGFATWDANGSPEIEVTDRLTRLHSVHVHNVQAWETWETVSVPGMAPDGTWGVSLNRHAVSMRIINGGFQLFQRYGGGTITPTTIVVFRC